MFSGLGAADNETDELPVHVESEKPRDTNDGARRMSRSRAAGGVGSDAAEAAPPRVLGGQLQAPTRSGHPTRQGFPRFPNRPQPSECVLWTLARAHSWPRAQLGDERL